MYMQTILLKHPILVVVASVTFCAGYFTRQQLAHLVNLDDLMSYTNTTATLSESICCMFLFELSELTPKFEIS